MMMGPDPIKRIDLMSVRLGILTSFLQMICYMKGSRPPETIGSPAQNFKRDFSCRPSCAAAAWQMGLIMLKWGRFEGTPCDHRIP